MRIIVNNELEKTYTDERGGRKIVYFTLVDDNDVEYKMLDDLPADVDAQEYLDANIDRELLFVRQEEYRGLPITSPEQEKSLSETINDWIENGCKVHIGQTENGEPVYRTIEKRSWRARW